MFAIHPLPELEPPHGPPIVRCAREIALRCEPRALRRRQYACIIVRLVCPCVYISTRACVEIGGVRDPRDVRLQVRRVRGLGLVSARHRRASLDQDGSAGGGGTTKCWWRWCSGGLGRAGTRPRAPPRRRGWVGLHHLLLAPRTLRRALCSLCVGARVLAPCTCARIRVHLMRSRSRHRLLFACLLLDAGIFLHLPLPLPLSAARSAQAYRRPWFLSFPILLAALPTSISTPTPTATAAVASITGCLSTDARTPTPILTP
ncbi:hypothetical protein B0H19DRAFT_1202456, partial [Mycena capillaripes]